uniref:Uncharacterized protein n=1 Tax=Arundo donax TaxID=35708 RepID=A0A0A8XYE8_ARUDO
MIRNDRLKHSTPRHTLSRPLPAPAPALSCRSASAS